MASYVQDMVEKVRREPRVARAENYVTVRAKKIVTGVKERSHSYKKEAGERVGIVRSFTEERIRELRTADSLKGYIYIILGIVLTVIELISEFLIQARIRASVVPSSVYRFIFTRLGYVFENVKEKASELPNTPVGRKVESVSKRVLGDSRHDQAVEFIKSEVFPRFERVISTTLDKNPNTNKMMAHAASSPSGESGRSTEVGSSPQQNNKQKVKAGRK